MITRKRRIGSVKNELLQKSKEAALAAVQVFNNPLISFKSEMFVVNMHIAWTYLMHAYFRSKSIEYRYIKNVGKTGKRTFDTTKSGAHKYYCLEDCLADNNSPIDTYVVNNLQFLIGLRHEIEHRMTSRIDDAFSAKFQSCCLDYNETIKNLFGQSWGLDQHLSYSLQLASLTDEQVNAMMSYKDMLPGHIARFIEGFEGNLSEEEFNSPKYAYRVLYTTKTVNRPGQADRVIEFIDPSSEEARGLNITYAVNREKEKPKYRAKDVINAMHSEGYPGFGIQHHTALWKKLDAKKPTKDFCIELGGQWFWYDSWVNTVRQHCKSHKRKYSS